MRESTDRERMQRFMAELGRNAKKAGRVYFTGGATAVWHGWRANTVDLDVKLPEDDAVFEAIPRIKEQLHVNIEQACPSDFIPELPGWEDRSIFIAREGKLDFFHYDPYSQALSKIQRGHDKDLQDVDAMLSSGMVDRDLLWDLFERIEPRLNRYTAIDAATFRRHVDAVVNG